MYSDPQDLSAAFVAGVWVKVWRKGKKKEMRRNIKPATDRRCESK